MVNLAQPFKVTPESEALVAALAKEIASALPPKTVVDMGASVAKYQRLPAPFDIRPSAANIMGVGEKLTNLAPITGMYLIWEDRQGREHRVNGHVVDGRWSALLPFEAVRHRCVLTTQPSNPVMGTVRSVAYLL